jgi:hypothetical protein
MIFTDGRAKRLDDIDLPKIGARIGVGEDELHAVIDVESRGTGFDRRGRPIILFERHWFHRLLPKAKRAKARNAGLATTRWSRATYNKDQYTLLHKAMEIDEEAALKSCSWGLFQIMGFNHEAAGYSTVYKMIEAFKDDEEHHLNAAVTFIITNKLDDELRRHDWAGFAKGYNGSGYKANRYDTKLANAYAKWKRIKDTPYDPNAKELVEKVAAEGRVSKTKTAAVVIAGGTILDQVTPIVLKAQEAKSLWEAVENIGWDFIIPLAIVAGAIFVWLDRDKYAKMAKSVKSKATAFLKKPETEGE